LIAEGCSIAFAKRSLLVKNRFTFREGWFNCTLCNKKTIDYESSLPHIESDKHKKKLRWVADENIDGLDELETGGAKAEISSRPAQHPIIGHLENCTKHISDAISLATDPTISCVSSEELQCIQATSVEIADLLVAATEKFKGLKKIVPVTPSQCKLSDGRTCLLCFQRERSKYFLPCKHFVLCNECMSCLTPKICPICREEILECHDVIAS